MSERSQLLGIEQMVAGSYIPHSATIARAGLELERREQSRRDRHVARNALVVLGTGLISSAAVDNTRWKPKLLLGATLLTAAYRLHKAR